MEIVRILYFSATYFSAIGQSISPYSIRIRENKDQKNSEYCCIKNPIKHMRWSFMWKQPAPIFPLFRNQPVDLLSKSIKWLFFMMGTLVVKRLIIFARTAIINVWPVLNAPPSFMADHIWKGLFIFH